MNARSTQARSANGNQQRGKRFSTSREVRQAFRHDVGSGQPAQVSYPRFFHDENTIAYRAARPKSKPSALRSLERDQRLHMLAIECQSIEPEVGSSPHDATLFENGSIKATNEAPSARQRSHFLCAAARSSAGETISMTTSGTSGA